MALISGGILVLMWILGHDFSGHYNRLDLISVDIVSGVYCIAIKLNGRKPRVSRFHLKGPSRALLTLQLETPSMMCICVCEGG